MRILPLLLMAAAAMGANEDAPRPRAPRLPDPDDDRDLGARPWRRSTKPEPLARACPTCDAAADQECRRATRGRWRFHAARLEAR
jgi:hypothetical protein